MTNSDCKHEHESNGCGACSCSHHAHCVTEGAHAGFSEEELHAYVAMDNEELKSHILAFLASEDYGRAVPLQQILIGKLREDDWAPLAMERYRLALSLMNAHRACDALDLWDSVIHSLKRVQEPWFLCECYWHAGKCALSTPDETVRERGRGYFEEGMALARAQNLRTWQATFDFEFAELDRVSGQLEDALKRLGNVLPIWTELGEKVGIVHTKIAIGECEVARGRESEAKEHLEHALDLARMDPENEMAHEREKISKLLSDIGTATLMEKLRNLGG